MSPEIVLNHLFLPYSLIEQASKQLKNHNFDIISRNLANNENMISGFSTASIFLADKN